MADGSPRLSVSSVSDLVFSVGVRGAGSERQDRTRTCALASLLGFADNEIEIVE
jgi:hypothetical protein